MGCATPRSCNGRLTCVTVCESVRAHKTLMWKLDCSRRSYAAF